MQPDVRPDRRAGLLAWLITVTVGAGWQLATRFGVTTTLTPIDLALLRYAIPALALFPILMRDGFLAKDQPLWILALIVIGGGLPFGLLGMVGAQFAPASHMGALLPGSMPIFVTLLSKVFLGERFGRGRVVGLGIIVLGVACVVGTTLFGTVGGPNVLLGDALFISAGVFWAIYTVAYRKSGLDPWHGAALICFWSSILVLPIWIVSPSAALLDAPLPDIALQVAAQGILAGLIGLAAYGVAIRHLGASVAAVSGAVVPALTALGGYVLLGEPLSWLTAVGVICVAVGIWAYAGSPGLSLLSRRKTRPGGS
ncbi:DMT family transporter [Marivita hallyeonensis]|uniref:EamA-like transporter family protein n=1 Tax=Marivita hallyeonensis TaxID=996342 RepID=A0A1M5W339_9RHOB|nr:DMT family transporter [Marivita hallyeonensis]SHH81868.1 EamA-like transporter family protein [Marivita hallyeonensis]